MKTPRGRQDAAATLGSVAGTCAPFDPFGSSFEEAQRLQGMAADQGPDGPLFQWVEAQRLTASRACVEKGIGFDVLEAVAGCAWHGLAMPDWLARAFLRRYRQVQRRQVDSWDAETAFGKPHPLNAQVGAMRRRRDQRLRVWIVVTDYVKRHPDSPMDPLWRVFDAKRGKAAEGTTVPADIVERVRQIGCSRSTAQERYREACETFGHPDDHAIRANLSASSAKVAGIRKPA